MVLHMCVKKGKKEQHMMIHMKEEERNLEVCLHDEVQSLVLLRRGEDRRSRLEEALILVEHKLRMMEHMNQHKFVEERLSP